MILLKPALIGQSKMLNINTKGETLNIHIKYQSELRKHKTTRTNETIHVCYTSSKSPITITCHVWLASMRYNCIVYYIYIYITFTMSFGTSGWFILLRVQEASDRIAAECCLARPVHVPGRRKDRWKKDMVEKAKRSQSESAKMWILQAKNRDRLLFPVCSMGWCDWNKVKVVSIGGCSIVPNSCTFCHYHCGCSWKIPLVVGYMLPLFRYSITRCIISCYVFSKPSSNPVLQQLGKGHRFGNAQVQLRFALQAASFRRWTNNWMSNAVSKIDVYDSWVPWAAGLASSLRAYVVMHSGVPIGLHAIFMMVIVRGG